MSHPPGRGAARDQPRCAARRDPGGRADQPGRPHPRDRAHGRDGLHRRASADRRRPRRRGRPRRVDRRQAGRAALARTGGAVRRRRAPGPRRDHLRHRQPRRRHRQPVAATRRRGRRARRRGRAGRRRAAHARRAGGHRPGPDPRARRRLARPDHAGHRAWRSPRPSCRRGRTFRSPTRCRPRPGCPSCSRTTRPRRPSGSTGRADRRVELLRRALHGHRRRAGIIANGDVFRGASGNTGEIGHICLDIDGPPAGAAASGASRCWPGLRPSSSRPATPASSCPASASRRTSRWCPGRRCARTGRRATSCSAPRGTSPSPRRRSPTSSTST